MWKNSKKKIIFKKKIYFRFFFQKFFFEKLRTFPVLNPKMWNLTFSMLNFPKIPFARPVKRLFPSFVHYMRRRDQIFFQTYLKKIRHPLGFQNCLNFWNLVWNFWAMHISFCAKTLMPSLYNTVLYTDTGLPNIRATIFPNGFLPPWNEPLISSL